MKQKQLYLNMAFTAVAVVGVCALLIYMARIERAGGYQSPTETVSHTRVSPSVVSSQDAVWTTPGTRSQRSRVVASPRTSAAVPSVAVSGRSIAPVRTEGSTAASQSIAPIASNSQTSVAPHLAQSSQTATYNGGVSPVAQLSILSFQRASSHSNSGLLAANDPTQDAPFERPNAGPSTKVLPGSQPGEPFPEPIGSGLWFLLALAGVFGLVRKRK